MKSINLLLAFLCSSHLAAQSFGVVYQEPGTEKIIAQRHVYSTVGDTALHFDLYLPSDLKPDDKVPLVVFVNGVGAMDMPEWQVYKDWARLVANRHMAAVTFETRPEPFNPAQPNRKAKADTEALLEFLRQNAARLQFDAARIGVFCCSANVKTAMPVVLQPDRDYIRALVIYYGSTNGAIPLRQDLPILMARAGQDNVFQNEDMARFFDQALRLDAPAEFVNYPAGLHAFDILNDTEESRGIIRRTLDFFAENLQKPASKSKFVLTPGNLNHMIFTQQRTPEAMGLFRQSLEEHHAFVKANPSGVPFVSPTFGVVREETLNQIGYKLLQNKRLDEALSVFEQNQNAWPESPNVYDALSDVQEAKGNPTEALRYAELALKKLDAAKDIDPQWSAAIRRSVMDKMKRLKKD